MFRGKDDRIDARRIAEYAERFQDKAVAYGMPDKTLSSIKELLSDRDTLLEDRKRYQIQLNDQKNFMDARDYRRKSRMWKAVIITINQQLEFIDEAVLLLRRTGSVPVHLGQEHTLQVESLAKGGQAHQSAPASGSRIGRHAQERQRFLRLL